MTLGPGWNLIGNPFPFAISWDDVLSYNNSPNLVGKFLSFDDGFLAIGSQIIAPYRGGFVYSHGATLDLFISASQTGAQGGRVITRKTNADLSQENWDLPLELIEGEFTNKTCGIGMNVSASSNAIDEFDIVSLPTLPGLPPLNLLMSSENESTTLSKQIVQSGPNHHWQFEVLRSDSHNQIELRWDNQNFGNNEKRLFLLVPGSNLVVDMRTTNSAVLDTGVKNISFVFGNDEFVGSVIQTEMPMLGAPFPNPADHEVTIPFRVSPASSTERVILSIFNSVGQCIATPVDNVFEAGLYETKWSGTSGYYIVKMNIGRVSTTQKILIK